MRSLAKRCFTLESAKTGVAFKIGDRSDVDFFGAKRSRFAFHAGDHLVESLAFGGKQCATADFSGS